MGLITRERAFVDGLSQRIETFVRRHIRRLILAKPPHMAPGKWVAASKKVGCEKSTRGLRSFPAFMAVHSPEGHTSGGLSLGPAAKAPSYQFLRLGPGGV